MPVLNEAAGITAALARLRRDFPGCELVAADGGSTDGTTALAAPLARVVASGPGRARQMNAGARRTSGEVLWFVHADTRIAPAALGQIRAALADPATAGGGLTLRFDRTGPALRWIAWTSNLRARYLRWVFGDQAMFIRRTAFDALGGFPDLPLMEDLEMSRRLRRHGKVVLLPAASTASARRFTKHGAWRMLAFMQYLKLLYFAGVSPQRIHDLYRAGPRGLAWSGPRLRRPGAGRDPEGRGRP
jgi:rSAM/selenodomain-associated transferase 2